MQCRFMSDHGETIWQISFNVATEIAPDFFQAYYYRKTYNCVPLKVKHCINKGMISMAKYAIVTVLGCMCMLVLIGALY